MSRSPDVTVCVRPSALLTPALFLLLTDTPILLAALLPAALLHELAHYAVLRLCGVRAARFTLTGLGASLYVPELHRLSYGAELLSAAAGPLMNLLLWVLLSLTGREALTLFAGAQMVLGVLNLLPVRPMAGHGIPDRALHRRPRSRRRRAGRIVGAAGAVPLAGADHRQRPVPPAGSAVAGVPQPAAGSFFVPPPCQTDKKQVK